MSSTKTPINVHATSQSSFTANAALYDTARPSYIPSAVDAMVSMLNLGRGSKVLDLACGTGIFTRLLLNKGLDLIAADPSPGMLATFSKRTPEIPTVAAGAYELPFPDSTFDAVTIAQAFHWFADESALTEIARVLKPRGRLGMIWNLEKTGVHDYADELFHEVVAYDGDVPQYRKMDWKPVLENTKAFKTPYEEFLEDFDLSHSPEELWNRAQSKSFITSQTPEEQQKLKARMMAILDRYPDAPKDAAGKIIFPQFVRVVALEKVA